MQSSFITYFDEIPISPWRDSPFKLKPTQTRLKTKRLSNSTLIKFSPYKQSSIAGRLRLLKRSSSIIEDFTDVAPAKTNAFPARKNRFSTQRILKPFSRFHSCRTERISLFEIETIERLQRLLPLKTTNHVTVNKSIPMFRNNSVTTSTSFLITPGTARLNYKRYFKKKLIS